MEPVRRFRSLALVFSISATDTALHAHLDELFDALATTDSASVEIGIEERDAVFVVRVNRDVVVTTDVPSHAVAHAVWEINRRAIEVSGKDALLLHAAAAQRGEDAVLLSGPSGSGKSTMIAALVSAGFGYLTDDAVAIDPHDGTVYGYPKPIGLSRDVLDLFPGSLSMPTAIRRYLGDEWFVSVSQLGGSCGKGGIPRLAVFPTYAPDATNEAQPVSRAEALVMLAENAFNFNQCGVAAMDLLARVVSECACYRMRYSDIDGAVEFIESALERASAEPHVA
jgi:hypothetical protein